MNIEDTRRISEVRDLAVANEYLSLGWVLIGMKYENSVYVLAWQKDGEPPVTEWQAAFQRRVQVA